MELQLRDQHPRHPKQGLHHSLQRHDPAVGDNIASRIHNRPGNAPAAKMAHLPQSQGRDGTPGMIDVLRGAAARRNVRIHINNSHPMLDNNSRERRELDAHGRRSGLRRHGNPAVNP